MNHASDNGADAFTREETYAATRRPVVARRRRSCPTPTPRTAFFAARARTGVRGGLGRRRLLGAAARARRRPRRRGGRALDLRRAQRRTAALRAFYNVCRHRGTRLLASGECRVKRFIRCPYHSWAYDHDGRCVGTPLFTGSDIPADQQAAFDMHDVAAFDRADHGLLPVAVDAWGPLVFVNLDPDPAPLPTQLGDLPARTAGYRLDEWELARTAEYEIAANYKLVAENFMEYYHLPWVHPGLVKVSPIDAHHRWQGTGMYVGFCTSPIAPDTDDGGWQSGLAPISRPRRGRRHASARFVWLFPNVAINILPNHLFVIHARPRAPGLTHETPTCSPTRRRPAPAASEQAVDGLAAFWDAVNREDIGIVERVQAGPRLDAVPRRTALLPLRGVGPSLPEHGRRPHGRRSARPRGRRRGDRADVPRRRWARRAHGTGRTPLARPAPARSTVPTDPTRTDAAPGIPAPATDGTPVTTIRVLYPDLHGVARGKDVPIGEFDRVLEHGLAFCAAVMGTDLRHTPVVGGEAGYPDLVARPDLATLHALPWEPGVAAASPTSSRRRRAAGPPTRAAPSAAPSPGWTSSASPGRRPRARVLPLRARPGRAGRHAPPRRQPEHGLHGRPAGRSGRPRARDHRGARAARARGLRGQPRVHELQYEINLRHADALTAADRAFRLKAAVKDIAAQHGLVATFMGKPFNDQGGSGAHLHVSLDRRRAQRVRRPRAADGVAPVLGAFTAGLLAHAPALTALLPRPSTPTAACVPDALAPTHANWGWDNRTTFVRVPPERGVGTRVEVRVGDGTGNPYLAIAALLAAGRRDPAIARPAAARSGRRLPRRGRASAPRCPHRSTRRSTRSRPTPRSAPRSAPRSSRRSWRSSGPRAIATTPGSRTGTWPSTWTTYDARPRRR